AADGDGVSDAAVARECLLEVGAVLAEGELPRLQRLHHPLIDPATVVGGEVYFRGAARRVKPDSIASRGEDAVRSFSHQADRWTTSRRRAAGATPAAWSETRPTTRSHRYACWGEPPHQTTISPSMGGRPATDDTLALTTRSDSALLPRASGSGDTMSQPAQVGHETTLGPVNSWNEGDPLE